MYLAKTCATCKYSVFKRTSKIAYWPGKMSLASTDKGHIGVCLLRCEGDVPKVRSPRMIWSSDRGPQGLRESYYVELAMDIYTERYSARKFYEPGTHRAQLVEYYRAWHKNYGWWQENLPLARRCHRALSCGSWEETSNKSRESAARDILNNQGDRLDR